MRHHDAIVVPAMRPSSTSGCVSVSFSAAATTLVVVKGPGAAAQPISWAITARSTTPRPLTLPPPWASSTSSEVQPSSAPRFQ